MKLNEMSSVTLFRSTVNMGSNVIASIQRSELQKNINRPTNIIRENLQYINGQ